MSTTSEDSGLAELLHAIRQIEDRISRIERYLDLSPAKEESTAQPPKEKPQQRSLERNEALENQIGETVFARLAILVLAIGVSFLLTFPFRGLPPVLPSLFGYALVAGTWTLSYRWRKSLPQLSSYIFAGTLLLLYFTTLRLFFFSAEPAVENKGLELAFLLLAVGLSMFVSVRRRSPFLAVLTLTAGYCTALISGEALFVFVLCALLAFIAVLLARWYGWEHVLLYATMATYLTHFIWAIGNPVMGHEVQLLPANPLSAISILLYALILAGGTLLRAEGMNEEGIVIVNSFANGLAGYGLFFLLTLARNSESLSLYHAGTSLVFLLLSTLFWKRKESRYSTFVYAMLGYAALSVAIIAAFRLPDYFVWLACQSILVISTGVWFRSRFIIGANFVIYIVLFIAYLILAGTVSLVSIIFGLVALLSARILNWQKSRLELKTEMMRNGYLGSAFFIIPYALYHTVPAAYVSISWVAIALFYFLMSILLKNNRKYRWMALLTLCLTIGYVFLVDMVKLDPAFRIVSFLVLGGALLWISVLYARKRTKAQIQSSSSLSSHEIEQTIQGH